MGASFWDTQPAAIGTGIVSLLLFIFCLVSCFQLMVNGESYTSLNVAFASALIGSLAPMAFQICAIAFEKNYVLHPVEPYWAFVLCDSLFAIMFGVAFVSYSLTGALVSEPQAQRDAAGSWLLFANVVLALCQFAYVYRFYDIYKLSLRMA